jgi:Tol biopolymer transport system component
MNWRLVSLIALAAALASCNGVFVNREKSESPTLISERLLVSEAWDGFKWSPDGKQLLLSRSEYQEDGSTQPHQVDAPIAIVDAESGDVQIISETGYLPQWSPDGKAVLLQKGASGDSPESFGVYSIDSGQYSRLPRIATTYQLPWLESGLYYQDAAGLHRLQILGLPVSSTGSEPLAFSEPELQLAFDGRDFARSAFPSPDGKTFLLIDQTDLANRRWWLIQPDGRQVEMVHPLYSLGTCCAWSRDSKRLAYFGLAPGQGLYIVDSNGKNLQRLVSASQMGEGAFLALDFSPDGRWIAYTWTEAGEGFPFDRNQIYVVRVDGSGLRQLTADGSHPHNWLRWSPDGRYIASLGNNGEVWLAEVQVP